MNDKKDIFTDYYHQLETLLLQGDILNEANTHSLTIIRNHLEQIDIDFDVKTIEEKNKLNSILNNCEINFFCRFIKKYFSTIPSITLITIFDIIRFRAYINMKVYSSLCDYFFDLSLTYLISDSTINYLTGIEHSQSSLDEYFLDLFSSIGSRSIFTRRDTSYSIFVSQINIPTFFQLNESTERLLHAFLIYLNNHYLYPSSISILKWLVNMTDIYGFVPYFIKTSYPDIILQWMSMEQSHLKKISVRVWMITITVLYNIARHNSGVETLNELNAIDTLKYWKEQYISGFEMTGSNNDEQDILISYHLLYAILLEPKELKKENISNLKTILDYILERTIQAFDSPNYFCDSYNVCEFLYGLSKLVVNDKCLLYIFSRENIYELFLEKFFLFSDLCESSILNTIICTSLYTIMWSVSFQAEYNIRLKSNDRFLSIVEQGSKIQSNDEYALKIKNIAKGILFNLDYTQMDIKTMDNDNSDGNQTKVMISYSHKDIVFCKNLVQKIQENFQGDIWVDYLKLAPPYDDDWEEIAKAITESDVILMIVTENYCSSKNCRREVIHADKRNKRMIPVYQGRDYTPDDWFEIRVGSATWVRFYASKTDEEVIENLLGLINAREKVIQIKSQQELNLSVKSEINSLGKSLSPKLSPTVSISDIRVELNRRASGILSGPSIEKWTAEQIQQYLPLSSSALQLSSGQALLTYMKLLSTNDAQYDEYENHMRNRGVSREEFANFLSSFYSLNNTNNALINISNQSTRDDIKIWFEKNHLSENLFNALNFTEGSQLIIYGKLLVDSQSRIDEEYHRLKNQIGTESFHLDEFARFLNALKKVIFI